MLRTRAYTLGLTILVSGAFACGDGDGGDTGPIDTGARDAGQPDFGQLPDMGRRDFGPRPDLGSPPDMGPQGYCVENGEVTVGVTQVPLADAMGPHTTNEGNPSRFSCIDNPPDDDPMFTSNYCFVECVDFLGYTPTQQEIDALEFNVFPLLPNVDPSYDFNNGLERSPGDRLGVGAMVTSPQNNDCDSGFQIEFGFDEFGSARFETEVRYVIRVRNALNQADSWVTTYHHGFIRRNDQSPLTGACGVMEARVPSRAFTFPIVHRSLVESAVQAAGTAIPGSDNLFDGTGNGYVMTEVRDCSGASGSPSSGASVGVSPMPLASVYPDASYDFTANGSLTSSKGLHFAMGFTGTASTSSAAVDVAVAMGVTREQIGCTEEYGGQEIPVFSDSITFLRGSRETVLNGRQP